MILINLLLKEELEKIYKANNQAIKILKKINLFRIIFKIINNYNNIKHNYHKG